MSTKSAGQAVQAGYKNIRVMLAGEPAWVKAGYPTYANYGWVCRGNIVLIDLRSPEKDSAERIPRSVNIPFAQFADSYDEIPLKAPVVLYSDNEEETTAAMRMLLENGYKNVSMVEGGILGWKQLGGNLEKGPVVTDINWKRILAEGEVSVAEFKKALADPKEATILDVRTREEVAAGKFPNSQHIPLDELCKDMDQFVCKIKDLQKNEKIYIHCTTGARAEMAYNELKKRDFNAFYLIAEVDCSGNDCSIEE
ncbi:MAG: rhodanese-like domain-containing protein [Proteobacteria bacterium]|nr:rhodanese-like domain-containing protein [Pseudomonadota bacterium]